jgi:uncharacterized membrane protein YbhN (UPF0104 family)
MVAGIRLLQGLQIDRVAGTLRQADLRLFALALLVNLTANMAARVARAGTLLRALPRPGGRVTFRELAPSIILFYAANTLLPARAGDALYVVLVHRRHGFTLGDAAAAEIAEKIVQALSLWVMALVAVALIRPAPMLAAPLWAFVGVGFVGLAALVWTGRSRRHTPSAARPSDVSSRTSRLAALGGFFRRLQTSLRLLNAPAVWLRALAWGCISDFIDVGMIGLSLAAAGIRLPLGAWFLILLTVNLAVSVPSTPGQVGVHEATAILVLGTQRVGVNEALVFALLYHAAHVLPVAMLGLLGLLRGTWSRPSR